MKRSQSPGGDLRALLSDLEKKIIEQALEEFSRQNQEVFFTDNKRHYFRHLLGKSDSHICLWLGPDDSLADLSPLFPYANPFIVSSYLALRKSYQPPQP